MTLDELYTRVTDAIRRAESLETVDPPAARMAYFHVSTLEEEIAELLPADDEEGAAARRGVVTAALRAQQSTRALELAEHYLAALGVPDHLRADLEALRDKARQAIPAIEARVRPLARFEIRSLVA